MNPDPYLRAFNVQNPEPYAQTPRAHLWRVDGADGPAVLKVLTDRGLNAGEMIGAKLLKLWNGRGAVRLLAHSDNAMLLEWLEGPALKDWLPEGRDQDAARIIAEVSGKLRHPAEDGYLALENHFGGTIYQTNADTFPATHRKAFRRAQGMWQYLLESTKETCLMHGDLNYENIMWSGRGWCAIDPKGILADPCYEFGIAFRNPVNDANRIAKPERISALAGLLASHTGLDKTRILQFGFVHVAMSLAYHWARGNFSEADAAILAGFDSLKLPSSP